MSSLIEEQLRKIEKTKKIEKKSVRHFTFKIGHSVMIPMLVFFFSWLYVFIKTNNVEDMFTNDDICRTACKVMPHDLIQLQSRMSNNYSFAP